MTAGNEIEIYYRWCTLDKVHYYSVVCKNEPNHYGNYWIGWLWFRMGQQFTKKELQKFRLSPYSCSWDKNERLIKEYKTVNFGTDRVIPAIRNHFKKLKQ